MKIRSLAAAATIGVMILLAQGAAEAAELKVLSAIAIATGHGRPRAEVRARDRTQARDHVRPLGRDRKARPRW